MKNTNHKLSFTNSQYNVKHNLHFAILLVLAILLNGCAKKDPVENVIDYHQQHIADILDYAINNIDQTKDVIFLENELKNCDIAYADIKQAYYGQISTCEAKTSYWRLASISLFLALCLSIFIIIKKVF